MTSELHQYILHQSAPESDWLRHVRRQTHLKTLSPDMASDIHQGRLLSMISHMIRPESILEIGTFTGYATLCLAEGLYADGQIVTIERREELSHLIEAHMAGSDWSDQIKVIYGDATQLLARLDGDFDLIYLDAAKAMYLEHYDLVFDRWRSGGWMIVDNVLWYGNVTQTEMDEMTNSIHAFNEAIRQDDRVTNVILPIRDGLNLIKKL